MLFADDCATIAEDVETAVKGCDLISEWATSNEMEIGIKKCRILEIEPSGEEPILNESHHL